MPFGLSVAPAEVDGWPRRRFQFVAFVAKRSRFVVGQCIEAGTAIMDFHAIDSNFGRGTDAQSHLASLNSGDQDVDVAVNDDFLANLPCEYEHDYSSGKKIHDRENNWPTELNRILWTFRCYRQVEPSNVERR
jgi:hypothetical protein